MNIGISVWNDLSDKAPQKQGVMDGVITSGSVASVMVNNLRNEMNIGLIVWIELSDKAPLKEGVMDGVIASGSMGSVTVNTLAGNARGVGLNHTLYKIFPIFVTTAFNTG